MSVSSVSGPDIFPHMGISAVFPSDADPSVIGDDINSIAFSDDGKYCAFARTRGEIGLINTETGRYVALSLME